MSINAIPSVSLYEYYYQINNNKQKEEESQTVKELKKMGITPTDNEQVNVAMLKKAKKAEEEQESNNVTKETTYKDRPWADIMNQLGLSFNTDPKDDVQSIKSALSNLVSGIDDKELLADVKDLDDYVKSMYITYYNNDFDASKISNSLSMELEGISAINKARVL